MRLCLFHTTLFYSICVIWVHLLETHFIESHFVESHFTESHCHHLANLRVSTAFFVVLELEHWLHGCHQAIYYLQTNYIIEQYRYMTIYHINHHSRAAARGTRSVVDIRIVVKIIATK